ncbi:hypothetical protein [Scytonema sp. NUACC26]|uniref:hypothetical protein n=1 Tax=Scytonema sp. NUACC26 TaxID=3140176 RepID=UPI0034DCB262
MSLVIWSEQASQDLQRHYAENTIQGMKTFFQVLVVAVLTTIAGLENSHCVPAREVDKGHYLSAQAQIAADQLVAVALPELADVVLTKGESRSGRVIAIDPQKQTISMQRAGETTSIPLTQITKVVFRDGALAYRSNGRQIIRGERERPVGKPVTWSGIPLNTLNIKNPTQGQAVVNLRPPIVSPARLRGILAVARDRQYVVDEIQFNVQQNTMTIRVTPY